MSNKRDKVSQKDQVLAIISSQEYFTYKEVLKKGFNSNTLRGILRNLTTTHGDGSIKYISKGLYKNLKKGAERRDKAFTKFFQSGRVHIPYLNTDNIKGTLCRIRGHHV